MLFFLVVQLARANTCYVTEPKQVYFYARAREQMHTFTYARTHEHACTHTSVVHTRARARNPCVLVVCLLNMIQLLKIVICTYFMLW
jgi:hypothetical protein